MDFALEKTKAKESFLKIIKPFSKKITYTEVTEKPNEYGFRITYPKEIHEQLIKSFFDSKDVAIVEPELEGSVYPPEQKQPKTKDISRFLK